MTLVVLMNQKNLVYSVWAVLREPCCMRAACCYSVSWCKGNVCCVTSSPVDDLCKATVWFQLSCTATCCAFKKQKMLLCIKQENKCYVLIYILLTWKFQDMRAKNAPDSSAIWHEQECCFCFVSVFESKSALSWANHWFTKPFIKTVIWFAPEGFSRFERIVWMTQWFNNELLPPAGRFKFPI